MAVVDRGRKQAVVLTGRRLLLCIHVQRIEFVLFDKNSFTGNMDEVCASTTLKVAVADCQAEVSCTCCEPCCSDDKAEACHDYDLVDTIDWESNYERRFFNFGNATGTIEILPGAP